MKKLSPLPPFFKPRNLSPATILRCGKPIDMHNRKVLSGYAVDDISRMEKVIFAARNGLIYKNR